MSADSDRALTVLRALWGAQGQSREDLEATLGTPGTCKRMAEVSFDGLAERDPGGDLRAAWRSTLRREGKLSQDGSSVADLVLGPGQARD